MSIKCFGWMLLIGAVFGAPTSEQGTQAEPFALYPVKYDLHYNFLNLDGDYSASFEVTLRTSDFPPQDAPNAIPLTFVKYNMYLPKDSVTVTKDGQPVPILSVYPRSQDTSIVVKVSRLLPSSEYKVAFQYSGPVSSDTTKGIFRQYTTDAKNKKQTLIGMDLYPVYARNAFPCYDDLSSRVNFTITVDHPNTHSCIAPVKTTASKRDKASTTTKFELVSVPMYGLSFALVPYTDKQATSLQTVVKNKFWIPTNLAPLLMGNKDVVSAMQSSEFSKLVDQSNLDSLQIVAVDEIPKTACGYGIIYVRNEHVVKGYMTLSPANRKDFILSLINCMSRSFYGVEVSISSWSDVWLIESMATFLSYKVAGRFDSEIWSSMVPDVVDSSMEHTWDVNSLPVVNATVSTVADILKVSSGHQINKGASILRMMDAIEYSADSFVKALVSLVKAKQNTAINTKTFLDYISPSLDFPKYYNATTIFHTWLYEPQFPLVTVTKSTGKVLVNQKPYMSNMQGVKDNTRVWSIPVRYTTNKNTLSINTTWVIATDGSIATSLDKDQWIVVNPNGEGYFKTLYDQNNLLSVSAGMRNDFDDVNTDGRARLINDAFTLADSGKIPYDLALEISSYSPEETEYLPWRETLVNYKRLFTKYYFTDLRTPIYNYMASLVDDPRYYPLDRVWRYADSIGTAMHNSLQLDLACQFGNTTCLDNMYFFFNKTPDTVQYPRDYESLVFCYGRQAEMEKDSSIWVALKQQLYYNNSALSERLEALDILACPGSSFTANSSSVINIYLQSLIDGSFLAEDIPYAFKAITDKPQHVNQAFAFFAQNYDKFNSTKVMSEDQLVQLLIETSYKLGQHDMDSMNLLVNNSAMSTKMKQAITTAKANMAANDKIVSANYDNVKQWLKGVSPTEGPFSPPTDTPSTGTGTSSTPSGTTSNSTATPPPSTTPGAGALNTASFVLISYFLALHAFINNQ